MTFSGAAAAAVEAAVAVEAELFDEEEDKAGVAAEGANRDPLKPFSAPLPLPLPPPPPPPPTFLPSLSASYS